MVDGGGAAMSCDYCPSEVPVVSGELARRVISRLSPAQRYLAMSLALEWLVTRHEGLELYGISAEHVGAGDLLPRPYEAWETDLIALEFGIVAGLPCPFREDDVHGCILGGLGPLYNRALETGKAPYFWLPSALLRLLDRETYRTFVARKEIADAKVAGLSRNEDVDQRVHMGVEPKEPRIPTHEEKLVASLRSRGA